MSGSGDLFTGVEVPPSLFRRVLNYLVHSGKRLNAIRQPPKILRLWTVLIFVAIGLIFVRGFIFRPASQYPGSHFNQGKNAVWLGVEWVSQPHSDSEIAALAHVLADRQIKFVFAYTSYLRTDSVIFNSNYNYASVFVKQFKRDQPGITLLAWLGLPMPSLGGAANLADPDIRQKIMTISNYLVQTVGFDGIQLDPETVVSGDQNLILLLDETRQAIGAAAYLSLAAEKIQPIFPDVMVAGRYIGWSGPYYHQVALHVDQIAVMAYDTRLPLGWLYRELLRFEVIGMTRAVQGTGVSLLIGVPASEEITATHDPVAENIADGLQGVIDGLNDAEAIPATVNGIAIYPLWEMTPAKWNSYETEWLGIR